MVGFEGIVVVVDYFVVDVVGGVGGVYYFFGEIEIWF